MTVRRVSPKQLRKAVSPGKVAEAPPAGISPVLRASWKFAHKMAQKFSKEMMKDRADQLLKKLAKKFI
ncbi:MAG: hypothetical protein KJ732_02350 [Candidatus Margulisbacteria bacterium]|nr:hypothetical protein [Candidatus Margulisiibacteriota bacterium]